MVIIYQVRWLHTPYNYFVFALACADALTSVDSTLGIVGLCSRSHLRHTFVECVFAVASNIFITMSQLSCLMWVCVDRFLLINFPLWYRAKFTNLTSITIIVITFVFEFTMSYGVHSMILPFDIDEPDLVKRCTTSNRPDWYSKQYMPYRIVAQISILVCLTAQVSCVAVRKTKVRKGSSHTDIKADKEMEHQNRSVKIMVTLFFLFLLFWIPLQLGYVFKAKVVQLYFVISLFWLRFNSSINAFVYALHKGTFKFGFKYLIRHRPCDWKDLNRALMKRKITMR